MVTRDGVKQLASYLSYRCYFTCDVEVEIQRKGFFRRKLQGPADEAGHVAVAATARLLVTSLTRTYEARAGILVTQSEDKTGPRLQTDDAEHKVTIVTITVSGFLNPNLSNNWTNTYDMDDIR